MADVRATVEPAADAAAQLDERDRTVLDFVANRRLAHAVLFRRRHAVATPNFHYQIIDLIHSDIPNILILAFRGSGKSTLQEEATVLSACLGEFRNKVILGSTRERAMDRLRAIKYELEYNEDITYLFGQMVGPVWNEDKIVLTNNVCIQAFGPGQSFRGVKHLEWRPDRLDLDDFEDEETVRSYEVRRELRSWLRRVVFPACTPAALVRVYATPLDPDALPMHLLRSPRWTCRTYPIYRLSPDGERQALWPALYPLEWISEKQAEYAEDGAMQEFKQEYLCEPEDQESKVFTEAMLRVEPRIRTWHAVRAAYDPARSKTARSATTGHVVFSWIGRKLVIWRGGANLWMPDEIIDDIVRVNAQYRPVEIGVETTGLVEFIEQPLRAKSIQLGEIIPVRVLKPPKGQTEFIKALQPFFRAQEIEWASEIDSEARAQMLAFPTGRRDFCNALAYALFMRPGLPVYDGFGNENILEDIAIISGEPLYLAVNASSQYTTGVLVQFVHGGIRVLRSWVKEGPPGENIGTVVRSASLEAGRAPLVRCPPHHFNEYDTLGLRAACGHVPVELRPTGLIHDGRELIRQLLTQQRKGYSQFLVSTQAHWALNAMAGGFAQSMQRTGMLSDEPAEGPYKVLLEGLEAFAAMLQMPGEDEKLRFATTSKGRRYLTTMDVADVEAPTKDEWHRSGEVRGEVLKTIR
jgi:hypothetical protein